MGKPLFSGTPIINRLFAVIILALGAAVIGLQASWFANRAVYVDYSDVVNQMTGLQTIGTTTMDVVVAGGAILIVAGLVSLAATFGTTSAARLVYIAGLAIAVLGGIICIAGGAATISHPYHSALGPETYVANQNLPTTELTGDKLKMFLFGLSVFETCCRGTGVAPLNRPTFWGTSQGAYSTCGTTCPSAASGEFTDTRISQFQSFFKKEDLCSCVKPSQDTAYQLMVAQLTDGSICNRLSKFQIDYDPSLIVPTTCEFAFCLPLGFIKNTLFPATNVVKAPLVGFRENGEADPLSLAAPGVSFGCGIGFSKGVMWFQEIFHYQHLTKGATAALGLGAGAIAVVFLSVFISWFLNREDGDKHDNWENTLAAQWNDPSTNPVVPAATTKMEAAGPAASKVANASVGDDLTNQLVKFYAAHDPLKSYKEIEGIAKWGKDQGLPALNQKLFSKYKADLSTGAQGGGPPI